MSKDPNINAQSSPSSSCGIQVFANDTLIYDVDIDLSSSILELKISLHTQSLINIPPSEQKILFSSKECSNTTTFRQLYTQNDNQSPIKLIAIQALSDKYSV